MTFQIYSNINDNSKSVAYKLGANSWKWGKSLPLSYQDSHFCFNFNMAIKMTGEFYQAQRFLDSVGHKEIGSN